MKLIFARVKVWFVQNVIVFLKFIFRILDQSFFGSDTVQTAVLAPPEMTIDGLEAATSKDHQLIPIYDKQVMTREDERVIILWKICYI